MGLTEKQIKQRSAAGKIGGAKKVPKGFAVLGKEAASTAGKVGGAKGRRGPKIINKVNNVMESGIVG